MNAAYCKDTQYAHGVSRYRVRFNALSLSYAAKVTGCRLQGSFRMDEHATGQYYNTEPKSKILAGRKQCRIMFAEAFVVRGVDIDYIRWNAMCVFKGLGGLEYVIQHDDRSCKYQGSSVMVDPDYFYKMTVI